MKRGALTPAYRGTLRNADGSPIDLSGVDHVDFVMRERRTLTPVVEAQASVLQEGDAVTGTDVGLCEYDWSLGDTDSSGVFNAEFALYDANGNVIARVPSDGYQEIQILGNLSAAPVPDTNLPVTFDFHIYYGDVWSQAYRLLQQGIPVDLTGSTVASSVVDAQEVVTPLTVTILDATDGQLQISALPGALAVGSYDYDIQVTDATGPITWIKGQLVVDPDVTP
jgi:hypothetical protein